MAKDLHQHFVPSNRLSAVHMARLLGARYMLPVDSECGMLVPVEILDVKESYGTTRCVVRAIGGIGSRTVNYANLWDTKAIMSAIGDDARKLRQFGIESAAALSQYLQDNRIA